jgi:hypothetical protein
MPVRDQRVLLLAAVATCAALLLAAFAGHPELIAYAAPLCVVALPLLAGRYVGEQALERLRQRTEPKRRRVAAALAGARRSMSAFPRGGRLIAQALAERAPPAPALT